MRRHSRKEPAKAKKKILVIDDDILIRETVKLALQHEGFSVTALEDPGEAEDRARRDKPDLIVLDLYFPGVSGLDLCKKLKGDPDTRQIPVMIFTGSNETKDVMEGINAGAFEYITKPIDGATLVAKIKAMLKLK